MPPSASATDSSWFCSLPIASPLRERLLSLTPLALETAASLVLASWLCIACGSLLPCGQALACRHASAINARVNECDCNSNQSLIFIAHLFCSARPGSTRFVSAQRGQSFAAAPAAKL